MTLVSRAPHPALSEHPEFALMLAATLDRYHCTLAEVREDYWLGRAWRALAGDPLLHGRVARLGVGSALVTGPHFGPVAGRADESDRWQRHVHQRLVVDTAHSADQLGIAVRLAEDPVEIAQGCLLSLIAQTIMGDLRWLDLEPYADDLAPVVVPVAYAVGRVVAA
jgi:hypothetical protein